MTAATMIKTPITNNNNVTSKSVAAWTKEKASCAILFWTIEPNPFRFPVKINTGI